MLLDLNIGLGVDAFKYIAYIMCANIGFFYGTPTLIPRNESESVWFYYSDRLSCVVENRWALGEFA